KRQHVVEGQQHVACRGQSQRGEWLPSLKSPKRPTHLAWPVGLRMAMKDNKRGCKKKKRHNAAEVRKKATPLSQQRYHPRPPIRRRSLAKRRDRKRFRTVPQPST